MKAIFVEVIKETAGISSFKLEPETPIKYKPGQWVDVRLMDNGRWTMKHNFSLSSSPTEDFLQFTTKYRRESEYKKALWSKRAGDAVEIRGPFGEFVLDTSDRRPRMFIAGGIGITPFRSMIKYMTDKKLG